MKGTSYPRGRVYSAAPRIPPGRSDGLSCVGPREVFGHLGSAFPPSESAGPVSSSSVPSGSTLGSIGVESGRLRDHFGVLERSEGVLWRAQGHRKCSPSFSESPLSGSGASWEGSWGGFGGLGCSLGQSWEVRLLLFHWF